MIDSIHTGLGQPKFKVLHVINSLVAAGAENLVVTFTNEQVKDNDVTVFTFYSENDAFAERLNDKINFKPHKGKNYFSLKKIYNLYRCIKEHDVIHVHLFPPFYIVAFLSLFTKNKNFVYTEHNTTNTRRKWFLRWFERLVYARYNFIICISDGVYEALKSWVGNAAKTVVIKNVINTHFIESIDKVDRSEINCVDTDIILVMVGRFQSQKDQDTIIRAMQELPSQFKLILMGEGERETILKELVRTLHLENRVVFLGVKKNVFGILKACDIGIISSRWEGFGLVALEYMASDLPAIGSNNEGLKEVIGVEDALFEIGDPKGLANLILRLNEDEVFKNRIEAIQKENLKNFDLGVAIQKHKLVYTKKIDPC